MSNEKELKAQKIIRLAKNDYYAVLGVDESATDDELKSAYRKLARVYHPDKNNNRLTPSAEKAFKAISAAHTGLIDTEKRERYDNLGSIDEQTPAYPYTHENIKNFTEDFKDCGKEELIQKYIDLYAPSEVDAGVTSGDHAPTTTEEASDEIDIDFAGKETIPKELQNFHSSHNSAESQLVGVLVLITLGIFFYSNA